MRSLLAAAFVTILLLTLADPARAHIASGPGFANTTQEIVVGAPSGQLPCELIPPGLQLR